MKKIFTALFFVLMSFLVIAQNEIPNWDMEIWDSTVYDLPSQWQFRIGKINKETPPNSGNWACRLANDSLNQTPGVVMYGNSNDGINFYGGIPFNERPDSLKCFIKYDIPVNDSAYMLILLKNMGTPICYEFFPLAYGSYTSNYIQFAHKINYLVPTILPDSLIFAVICTNPNNQPLINGGYLVIDDITFTGSVSQVPNGDFESWDTSITAYSLEEWYNNNWGVYWGFPPAISKTTDNYSGNYALLLQNYVNPPDTVWGSTFTPSGGANPWDNNPAFPVSQRYNIFTFYFKYFPQNNDSMSVFVSFFYNHTMIGGCGYISDTAVTTNYKEIILPVYYSSPDIPDSARINIAAYYNRPKGNSVLYIDNLSFDLVTDISSQTTGMNDFSIYPNPFSSKTNISFTIQNSGQTIIEITDVYGKEIAMPVNKMMLKGNCNIVFDGSNLDKGIYFCRFKSGTYSETRKMVLVR